MRVSPFRRIAVLLIVLAVSTATTAYAAHVHESGGNGKAPSHCDLCLQFNGVADPPPPVSAIVLLPEFVFEVPPPPVPAVISQHPHRSHRSRAPPSFA